MHDDLYSQAGSVYRSLVQLQEQAMDKRADVDDARNVRVHVEVAHTSPASSAPSNRDGPRDSNGAALLAAPQKAYTAAKAPPAHPGPQLLPRHVGSHHGAPGRPGANAPQSQAQAVSKRGKPQAQEDELVRPTTCCQLPASTSRRWTCVTLSAQHEACCRKGTA
jgi:hypothetical protein